MDLSLVKKYAKENNVPIILDEGLALLKKTIETYHVKDALEIGSAIGYSALSMASFGVYVDTIERDPRMYKVAMQNIGTYDTEKRVRLIFADATSYDGIDKTYDLIFIDAAKSKYHVFFDRYKKYLNKGGIIVCDNMNFHNLDRSKVTRRTRQLLEKLDTFKEELQKNKDFETIFYNDGDGMSVSRLLWNY